MKSSREKLRNARRIVVGISSELIQREGWYHETEDEIQLDYDMIQRIHRIVTRTYTIMQNRKFGDLARYLSLENQGGIRKMLFDFGILRYEDAYFYIIPSKVLYYGSDKIEDILLTQEIVS